MSDRDTSRTRASSSAARESCAPPTLPWEVATAWALRAVIFATLLVHISSGQWLFAGLCILAISILLLGPLLSRSLTAGIPVELELIILWWLVADMSLGRLANLYETSLWFDKALHFVNPAMLGWFAFTALYTLHAMGRLEISPITMLVGNTLLTLGIGALWEIAEYLADLVFGMGAQGSPLMAPLDDTMADLMLDGLGGALGGAVGYLYIRYSRRSQCRIRDLARFLALRQSPLR
jgi:hypothetical protein